MKGVNQWSYAPYKPFLFPSGDIIITRIVPEAHAIAFWWLPLAGADTYKVFFRKEGATSYQFYAETKGCTCRITDLQADTDYEFYCQWNKAQSRIRLAHTGESVGTVVNYLHPKDDVYAYSGHFLCSPSMVRCPNGSLLASMDLFGLNTPQNSTLLFRSWDNGETWQYVTELMPCFWGRLFVHRGAIYMLACSTEYGDLLIGKSDDEGETFSTPTVLLRGSGRGDVPGVHKNPQPLVYHNGRIWNTLEWGCWVAGYHAAMVMSADENADLLDPENWSLTPPVPYNPAWPGVAEGSSSGNIEGCLVTAPDGALLNIMRYDMARCTPNYGRVLAYRVDTCNPEVPLTYDHAIALPGNHSKFEIHWDAPSGYYLAIISRIRSSAHAGDRNLLSLMKSRDLDHWELVCDLLDYSDANPKKVGFQYVTFMDDGEDLIWLSRTAINGADSYHNSNYITFHRTKGFRAML